MTSGSYAGTPDGILSPVSDHIRQLLAIWGHIEIDSVFLEALQVVERHAVFGRRLPSSYEPCGS